MMIVLGPVTGLLLSAGVATVYVLSLWMWRDSSAQFRDEIRIVKQRFVSCASSCILTLLMMAATKPSDAFAGRGDVSTVEYYGWTKSALLAVLYALTLNGLAFGGNVLVSVLKGKWKPRRTVRRVWRNLSGPWDDYLYLKLRDLVAAPLTEEIIYRCAVCYFTYFAGLARWKACVFSATVFASAHIHHMYEQQRHENAPLEDIFGGIAKQSIVAFLFGLYSAHIYMFTGSLPAVIALHISCNLLGPPRLSNTGLSASSERAVRLFQVVCTSLFFGVLLFQPSNLFESIFQQ